MDTSDKELEEHILNSISRASHYDSEIIQKSFHRNLALLKLKEDELQGIFHLTQSHAIWQNVSTELAYDFSNHKNVTLNKEHIKKPCSFNMNVEKMLQKVEEMPEEWTLVQITPKFNLKDRLCIDIKNISTPALHISVFDCGKKRTPPFCVTIDEPKDKMGNKLEICKVIEKIIQDTGALYNPKQGYKESEIVRREYWEKRLALDQKLKAEVKTMEDYSLKAWKCLFIGKFIEKNFEFVIDQKINKMLKEHKIVDVPVRSKLLLHYLIKGIPYVHMKDVYDVIDEILPHLQKCKDSKMAFYKSLKSVSETIPILKSKRQPVILIVDESLDTIPWEMMSMIQDHPVSRMPSLNLTYGLYKEHESSIRNGIKCGINPEKGKYIINPGLDLPSMQVRIKSFMEYWNPKWVGMSGVVPKSEEVQEYLSSSDIFVYCGHGSGSQYLKSNRLERFRTEAVVLLIGCSSCQLKRIGPEVAMYGYHQAYLTACSPCVVGMLWQVTDKDADALTVEFLSHWIASEGKTPWKNIDKKTWDNTGKILPVPPEKCVAKSDNDYEPELLRALCKAKRLPRFFLTQAACVVRGIPVKLGP